LKLNQQGRRLLVYIPTNQIAKFYCNPNNRETEASSFAASLQIWHSAKHQNLIDTFDILTYLQTEAENFSVGMFQRYSRRITCVTCPQQTQKEESCVILYWKIFWIRNISLKTQNFII